MRAGGYAAAAVSRKPSPWYRGIEARAGSRGRFFIHGMSHGKLPHAIQQARGNPPFLMLDMTASLSATLAFLGHIRTIRELM